MGCGVRPSGAVAAALRCVVLMLLAAAPLAPHLPLQLLFPLHLRSGGRSNRIKAPQA